MRDDAALNRAERASWRLRAGREETGVLVVVDHASAELPPGIDLGLPIELMSNHIALDIGTDAIANLLPYEIFAARFSRLFIDCNRSSEDPSLIPDVSDGIAIPGNRALAQVERAARITSCWAPYHQALADHLCRRRPRLIVSLHSFTPRLASRPWEERPWPVGILYNRDDRAARVALDWLNAKGINAGDQLPYSGVQLNYTMNRHAEANGIPYVGIELRQDGIESAAGQALWATHLRTLVDHVTDVAG